MNAQTKPLNEDQRLETLDKLFIFNSKTEERFDRVTRVLAALFDVPIAMVNLLGADTQISKSCFGMESGGKSRRDQSFCTYTILSDEMMVVEDALEDSRFKTNPNVLGGLRIRAYAGVALKAVDGTHPGALCLIDTKPRKFSSSQMSLLKDLSAWAEIELNSNQLREALDQVTKSRQDIEVKFNEMSRLNELMIGREIKMAEMKKRIAELSAKSVS